MLDKHKLVYLLTYRICNQSFETSFVLSLALRQLDFNAASGSAPASSSRGHQCLRDSWIGRNSLRNMEFSQSCNRTTEFFIPAECVLESDTRSTESLKIFTDGWSCSRFSQQGFSWLPSWNHLFFKSGEQQILTENLAECGISTPLTNPTIN